MDYMMRCRISNYGGQAWWEVVHIPSGEVLHKNWNRELAIKYFNKFKKNLVKSLVENN